MNAPRPPRRPALQRLPRPRVLPVFAALSSAAVLVLLAFVMRTVFELEQSERNPHRFDFRGRGVPPLLDAERLFDVGVSVFALTPLNETARPECSAGAEIAWYQRFRSWKAKGVPQSATAAERELHQLALRVAEFINGLPPSPCALLYVPDTRELWSGVVARNLSLSSLRRSRPEAAVDVDIPTECLKPLRPHDTEDMMDHDPFAYEYIMADMMRTHMPDVYAVVTLIPHVRDLRWVGSYKYGIDDLPLVGEGLLNDAEALIGHVDDGQQTGDTLSKNGSLADMKREYLSTMSVRVPLLSSSDSGRKQFLATKVQAVLVNQTKELSIHTFEDRFERLVKRGCNPTVLRPGAPHRLLCVPRTYAGFGHWHAQYVLGEAAAPPPDANDRQQVNHNWQEWRKRRYPPFLAVPGLSPMDYRSVAVGSAAHERHTFRVQLAAVDQPQLGVLEEMRAPPAPGLSLSTGALQQAHDRVQRAHALAGLAPRRTALLALLGFVLPYVAQGAQAAASALTVLYWATRCTTAGIAVGGTGLAAAGALLRAAVGTWDYYRFQLPAGWFWPLIAPLLLYPAQLQLRLVVPFAVRRDGDGPPWHRRSWRLVRVPPTARERRSARLALTPAQLGALAAVLACGAYALWNRPVRLVAASHSDASARDTYRWQYPGSRVWDRYSPEHVGRLFDMRDPLKYEQLMFRRPGDGGGPVWRAFMLFPAAQAMVSAGQVAQLVLNRRARTFAGNYALTCALKAAALAGYAAPFVARAAYHEGVFLAGAAQAALVLAEAAQAWAYPRVEQHVEGEELEP